jgi:hypothetical protein
MSILEFFGVKLKEVAIKIYNNILCYNEILKSNYEKTQNIREKN